MVEINNNNLEDALSSNSQKELPQEPRMSKDMSSEKDSQTSSASTRSVEREIGFHQGALNTLINERNELIKVVAQVEQVMQAHMKRLEELGIKIKTGKKE